ncbi:MAG: DUF421 domain-containing protein, partial [Dehalococcoidales bacterium]|nr:DUF421 domain-containing protein [Dehalococcoidales bacterium]
FDNPSDLWRILVVGILAYVGLVFFQRISGKRTLSKMNAFDLIVTVALGSTLATVLLSNDVSLSEGLLAFAILMLLQFTITWLSVRVKPIKSLVKSEPRLLFYQGSYLEHALNNERVLKEEVRQAIRATGKASLDDVAAVVMETDGSFSVIGQSRGKLTALEDIDLPDKQRQSQ